MIFKRQRRDSGSVLVMAIIISAILGVTLASYLSLVSNQYQSVTRSQLWNTALPATEAGIEEGLTQAQLASTNLAVNGWTSQSGATVGSLTLAGTVYTKTRTLPDGSTYLVAITPSNAPVITAVGKVASPFGSGNVARTVQVRTQFKGMFTHGLTAKGLVSMTGNVVVDSFDSTSSLYSTLGLYDPLKFKDNGSVATDANVVGAATQSGGVTIYGSVDTGPGGTDSVGSQTAIGSKTWITAGNTGIQAGHELNDMNVAFNDISAPFSGGYFTPTSGKVGGTNYTYVITSPGNYQLASLSMSDQSQMLIAASNVVLYVPGGVSLSGQSTIILGTGASVGLYLGASSSLTGQGIANGTGVATNFFVYGLPAVTSLSLSGNAGFIGVIYAPEAAFSMSGGGSKSVGVSGAAVVSTVTMNGNFQFHYDESLGRYGGSTFTIASWNEF